MQMIKELIDKGDVIKETISGTDIPVLWFTDTSLVDVRSISPIIKDYMYEVFVALGDIGSTPTLWTTRLKVFLNYEDVRGKDYQVERIDVRTEIYFEALQQYGISKDTIREILDLATFNDNRWQTINSEEEDNTTLFDWYSILSDAEGADVVRLKPIQVYMLLRLIMYMLLDKQAVHKLCSVEKNNRFQVCFPLSYISQIEELTNIIDRDTFPAKDIIYSLWNTYIDMLARTCYLKGGEE